MKTIMKWYENGNLETVNTPLVQSGTQYKFAENLITVPKIVEYPPIGYRNYFIDKTSVLGWVDGDNGSIEPADEGDRTSDFISVVGWQVVTAIVRFKEMNGLHQTWVSIASYDAQKRFIRMLFYDKATPLNSGDFVWQFQTPISTAFIRVTSNYYDIPGVDVKISVEKDSQVHLKHYLSPEDLPEWVKDTGNPISFFKEGIVIKGTIL